MGVFGLVVINFLIKNVVNMKDGGSLVKFMVKVFTSFVVMCILVLGYLIKRRELELWNVLVVKSTMVNGLMIDRMVMDNCSILTEIVMMANGKKECEVDVDVITLQCDKYDGEWSLNLCHGEGVYTTSVGHFYCGTWKSGKMHGYGLL